MLNVWLLAPHASYEPAPEPHWSRYQDDPVSQDQRYFRSMVSCLDARVGRILAKLDELGVRENTLVLFTSENGGGWEADNGPYKGGKTDLHEAGLRVPAIACWPGRTPAGQMLDGIAYHTAGLSLKRSGEDFKGVRVAGYLLPVPDCPPRRRSCLDPRHRV